MISLALQFENDVSPRTVIVFVAGSPKHIRIVGLFSDVRFGKKAPTLIHISGTAPFCARVSFLPQASVHQFVRKWLKASWRGGDPNLGNPAALPHFPEQ